MNEFCFIIPRTPSSLRTPIRELLWEACKHSLQNQEYQNWKVIIIGTDDKEIEDSRFEYIEGDEIWKIDKIKIALNHLKNRDYKPHYLIRLDDDDIFSKSALQYFAAKSFDCAFDQYHAFLEINSGRLSLQKRLWMPNTSIIKLEFATLPVEINGVTEPLIAHDHDLWWEYFFKNKKHLFSKKMTPNYVRIMSQTSITSLDNHSNESMKQYQDYLMKFGHWEYRIEDFKSFSQSASLIYKSEIINTSDKSFSNFKLNKKRLWSKLIDLKNKISKK